MKVYPFEIPKPSDSSLIYQVDRAFVFYDLYHQHQEIQLSYIKAGEGTLVVGDTVSRYQQGDIFAIGANLPHVFKSDKNTATISEMVTLFFSREGFGSGFFEREEFQELIPFFQSVDNGFKVNSHHQELQSLFMQLDQKNSLDRFILLLNILQCMCGAQKQSLSSYHYQKKYTANEGKRMQAIMSYTMNHFQEPITLSTIASIASMTKTAFCKYFKKRTDKTYIQFVNELRVESACTLLMTKKELPIATIGYRCGFSNLSNFNRQFKIVKKITPTEFREGT